MNAVRRGRPGTVLVARLAGLAAVAMVLAVVIGRQVAMPSASAQATGSELAAIDPTKISAGGDTYSIVVTSGEMVVSRTGANGTVALARVPSGRLASPASPGVAVYYVAQCGQAGAADERELVFGELMSADPGASYAYMGPPVDGGVAPNGLFLFVLRDVADDTQPATLERQEPGPSDSALTIFRVSFHLGLTSHASTEPYGCQWR